MALVIPILWSSIQVIPHSSKKRGLNKVFRCLNSDLGSYQWDENGAEALRRNSFCLATMLETRHKFEKDENTPIIKFNQ